MNDVIDGVEHLTVDGVVYNYVKRCNPKLLSDVFPLERRIHLLETSHEFEDITLVDMVSQFRNGRKPAFTRRECRTEPEEAVNEPDEPANVIVPEPVEGGRRRSARIAEKQQNLAANSNKQIIGRRDQNQTTSNERIINIKEKKDEKKPKTVRKKVEKDQIKDSKRMIKGKSRAKRESDKQDDDSYSESSDTIEPSSSCDSEGESEDGGDKEAKKRLSRRQLTRRLDKQHGFDRILYKYLVDNGFSEALPMVFLSSTLRKLKSDARKQEFPDFLQVLYDYRVSRLLVDDDKIRIWMCKHCGRMLRGKAESAFRTHIGSVHVRETCPCLIKDCKFKANSPSGLDKHLQQKHGILYAKDLDADGYHKFRQISKDFSHTMDQLLTEYFPLDSFVGSTAQRVAPQPKIAKKKEQTCIQCGTVLKSFQGMRSHVASHLNLAYSCPLDGCSSTVKEPIKLARHLVDVHKTRIASLNASQTATYRIMREEFNGILKENMPNFFLIVKEE